MYQRLRACTTYRQVVKVRKKEEDGQQGDDAQKHGTSRTLATGALIHLTSTVSAKGWQAHEATANHIGNAKCDHLSVGTQLNTLDGLARAQTLCSYRGLEESKKSNEKRCRHGASDMRHVFQLEWPLESQQLAVSSLDCSENFNTLAFPVKLPAENRRHDNNHKSIRNISNARVSRLEAVLHFTKHSVNTGSVAKPQRSHLPANHDDKKADSCHGECQPVHLVNVANHKPDLFNRASMAHARLVSQSSKS